MKTPTKDRTTPDSATPDGSRKYLSTPARARRTLLALLLAALPSVPAQAQELFEPLTLGLVEQLCKNPGKKFSCFQLDPDDCDIISPRLVDTCVTKHVRSKPLEKLVETSAIRQLAQDLDACIKAEFNTAFGEKKLTSPECKDV